MKKVLVMLSCLGLVLFLGLTLVNNTTKVLAVEPTSTPLETEKDQEVIKIEEKVAETTTPIDTQKDQEVIKTEEKVQETTTPVTQTTCPYNHENCDGIHQNSSCPYNHENCDGIHQNQDCPNNHENCNGNYQNQQGQNCNNRNGQGSRKGQHHRNGL